MTDNQGIEADLKILPKRQNMGTEKRSVALGSLCLGKVFMTKDNGEIFLR
jgi:hypothetical protein